MDNYFKATKFILELLYFYYQGDRYQGRGVMIWHPDDGFHLEAFLDDSAKPIGKVDIGKTGIVTKTNFCSIRMRLQGYDWAVASNILLSSQDELDIKQSRYLSIDFGKLVFCESDSPHRGTDVWTGSALYATKSNLFFTDKVSVETRINDQKLPQLPPRLGMTGIHYEQNTKLIGNLIDDRHLKVSWQIPKHKWTKSQAWQWNLAIQDVLSIWFGETIQLVQRQFLRNNQKITEIRQKSEFSSLGVLSPLRRSQLDKQRFMYMTEFFVREPSQADICRKIFYQLVEASNQHTRQAQELILSTILEAALRSIDKCPFEPKRKNGGNWNVGKGLDNFFKNYLPLFSQYKKRIITEHCYLRHRNAHPDWLFSQGGSLSDEERVKSLDSMIFLSHFYGYMILAISGIKDLSPEFPPPHKDWNPAATITLDSNTHTEDGSTDFMEEKVLNLAKELDRQKYYQKIIIARKFRSQQHHVFDDL